jgi:hypothetical protein
MTSSSPAQNRSGRALAHGAVVGLLAGSITVVAGSAAQAASPPVAPNNIVVFPQRDFVTLEGYEARADQQVTVIVRRGGVETSRAVGTLGAGDPSLEINHPGGVCWQGVTPNIKPGDVVRVNFPGGGFDSARTLSPEVTGFAKQGDFTLVVNGTRGPDASTARMEQRIVAPDLDATDVGRRDIRAPARPGPYTSTLRFPTATTFRATYTFVTDADTTAAEATQMRDIAAEGQMRVLSWQATDANDNRQGLTISEFGELGGPGFGGCPTGPETATPNAPTNVTATAGDASATASWSPATTIPDGSPITGYRVTAINTADSVETSINAPLCTTACRATIPNLANGATYRIEVRALSAAGAGAPGTAPATVTPAGTPVVQPVAPTAVTATAGDPLDQVINATVAWEAPAQPAGVTVEAWRITAYDAATLTRIKRVFLDEPTDATSASRTRPVGFASATSVVFKVQAIAADEAGTMSILSSASNAVDAQ